MPARKKDIHSKLDFDKITPWIYIGTNACCTSHFEERLIRRGIHADISLEKERLDMPYGATSFLWLPTRDHTAPTQDQLILGVTALSHLVRARIQTYVHCKNGHGRAPTLVAAYLILAKKMPVDRAIHYVAARRRGTHIEPNQRRALQKFAKTCHKLQES